MAKSTSDYYKSNPEAKKKRLKQQAKYNKTARGKLLIKNANKCNRDLGTYGNGDGKDASHTGPKTCKTESAKKNRTRPRKGKKYAPK